MAKDKGKHRTFLQWVKHSFVRKQVVVDSGVNGVNGVLIIKLLTYALIAIGLLGVVCEQIVSTSQLNAQMRTKIPIAILLVGKARLNTLKDNIRAVKKHIADKFDADVFVASSLPKRDPSRVCMDDSYIGDSIRQMGPSLKAVALEANDEEEQHVMNCANHYTNVRFVRVGPHKRYSLKHATNYRDWQNLRDAWDLMEHHETENNKKYQIVIKLRFDGTPYPWDYNKILKVGKSEERVVRHASDFAFWGRRDVMEVACKLADYLDSFWIKQRPSADSRPFFVRAFYQSMLSAPEIAWHEESCYVWRYYTKIGAMLYPNVTGGVIGKPVEMMESLRQLFCKHIHYVDPITPGSPPMVPSFMSKRCTCHLAGYFRSSERDFPLWMIYNNVTLCDIGGGTNTYLHGGKEWSRKSYDACITNVTYRSAECEDFDETQKVGANINILR
ncbi:hypothetical protein AAMO2058_000434700 [Amorphochlora amoebiformis]